MRRLSFAVRRMYWRWRLFNAQCTLDRYEVFSRKHPQFVDQLTPLIAEADERLYKLFKEEPK